jgi:hypothetical protein
MGRLALLLAVGASGCDTWHRLWFNAEDIAPARDSVPDDETDCSWFEDPQNCWNATAAAAAACVPDSGRTGVMIASGTDTGKEVTYTSCTYTPTNPVADYQVVFAEPVTLPLTSPTLEFTIYAAQQTECVSTAYASETEFSLVVAGFGTFGQFPNGSAPLWTCPDGSTVSPTFTEVVDCNREQSHLPAIALDSTATELTATINGLSGEPLPLFHCIVEPPKEE